jgi:hypothetical protein
MAATFVEVHTMTGLDRTTFSQSSPPKYCGRLVEFWWDTNKNQSYATLPYIQKRDGCECAKDTDAKKGGSTNTVYFECSATHIAPSVRPSSRPRLDIDAEPRDPPDARAVTCHSRDGAQPGDASVPSREPQFSTRRRGLGGAANVFARVGVGAAGRAHTVAPLSRCG